MPDGANLRVAALKKRASAAPNPPLEEEEEEEADTLGDLPGERASRVTNPGLLVPPARAPAAYTPEKSDDCFAAALEVEIPVDGAEAPAKVRTYFTPPRNAAPDGSLANTTVFVCHHGAGFGALSFALMAKEVTRLTRGEVGVLAYDCRGHGRSQFPDNVVRDMSLDALTSDLWSVLSTLFPEEHKRPAFVLIGHSMGGAVVTSAAHVFQSRSLARVSGVAMVDIVEGTSLRLLPQMGEIVRRRPEGFVSVEAAIQWHVETRTIRNLDSARRSVPSLVRKVPSCEPLSYRWSADLISTEPFWRGWFTGLSSRFLTCRAARLLILAETDNLDQELMIGQMQGKYQLNVEPQAGHCVQEVRITTNAGPTSSYGTHPRPVLGTQRETLAAHPRTEESRPGVVEVRLSWVWRRPRLLSFPMSFLPISLEEQSRTLAVTSVEVSSSALGGQVLECSDEWFAAASNLIKPGPAESLKGQFGPNGALYDGWESRRHNPTYDWAILRLGPSGGGRITGFDIDTTTFNGNEGPAAAVYGAHLPEDAPAPKADDKCWEPILPEVPCGPLAHHVYAYSDPAGTPKTYTHIQLHMIPDGGISRFRVYGVVQVPPVGAGVSEEVVPGHPELNTLDLAHVLNGGRVVYTNDQHFGIGPNILLPGRGKDMGDGWETKRSRTPNHHDWVVVRLGEAGVLSRIEIDTIHFLGNFPESCVLHGCYHEGPEDVPGEHEAVDSPKWFPILGRTKLGPGKQHYYEVEEGARSRVFTHVRLIIFPDGGIKRLRIVGRRNRALEAAGITTPEQRAALPPLPIPSS